MHRPASDRLIRLSYTGTDSPGQHLSACPTHEGVGCSTIVAWGMKADTELFNLSSRLSHRQAYNLVSQRNDTEITRRLQKLKSCSTDCVPYLNRKR